jgi:hypothetical protein
MAQTFSGRRIRPDQPTQLEVSGREIENRGVPSIDGVSGAGMAASYRLQAG